MFILSLEISIHVTALQITPETCRFYILKKITDQIEMRSTCYKEVHCIGLFLSLSHQNIVHVKDFLEGAFNLKKKKKKIPDIIYSCFIERDQKIYFLKKPCTSV